MNSGDPIVGLIASIEQAGADSARQVEGSRVICHAEVVSVTTVSKHEAAMRQLNAAIRMLFAEGDAVAVHTLVGAASVVLSDLVELPPAERSWDRIAAQDNGLTLPQYYRAMRRVQNYLKHAREDHQEALTFDSDETDALAFWAVMNASEVGPLSPEAEVFQLWYLASVAGHIPLDARLHDAIAAFGDLRFKTRVERCAIGAAVLALVAPGGAVSDRWEEAAFGREPDWVVKYV
jgi:hypothetical protein